MVTADALVAQLRLLPGCDDGMAERPATVSMLPAQPMRNTAAAPAPAPPAASAPTEPIAAPVPAPPAVASDTTDNAAGAGTGRIVIRFDNRLAALTPSGIRAFDSAVNAWRAGKPVQLAIDGCGAGADFTNGSPCARRLATLKQMLADNGIREAKKLLPEPR
jgi:hypothetical protein